MPSSLDAEAGQKLLELKHAELKDCGRERKMCSRRF